MSAREPKKPNNLFRLLKYVKPYWLYFAGATACGLIKFLMPVGAAWFTGRAIDTLQAFSMGKLDAEVAWDRLLGYVVVGSIAALLGGIPTFLRSSIGARAVQRVIRDLRCDLYAHIQKLPHSFFDANRSGSLTSRIIGDVEAVQPFVNQTLIQGWMNIGLIIIVLSIFFSQNVALGLLSMVLLPFHLLIQRALSWKVKENARAIRDRLAALSGSTQEKLAASTIVKAFTHEDDEVERFSEEADHLIDLGIRNSQLNGLSNAAVTSLNTLAPMLIIFVGGHMGLFGDGSLAIGTIVQFIMMQAQLYGPFERLNELQLVTANALGATDRIFGIFDTEPEIADRPNAVKAPHFTGEIEFCDITFTYPGNAKPIFTGLSLRVPARATVALVGPSGGGKTTLINLVNRFYEWQEGEIRIDGRDLRDYTIYSLRYQIGLVTQEPVLFSGTLYDNILYGRPDASEAEVREAARRAYADEFIQRMEDGYETTIGERGVRLSGGQKQRVSIARAFLKDPAIIILDEATSALDSESERIVQQALEELMRDRTTLVIAHRLATVRHADRIAVIADGRVAELGTHDELLGQGGIYTLLCRQQFGEEAVARDGTELPMGI
ncbi:MAG: ABC transporter ATP-binding protein [Armatimonadota bacterium]